MTSDLQTIVLLSCSLTLWLSYLPWSVLRLAQKQANNTTSSQHQTNPAVSYSRKEALLQCSVRGSSWRRVKCTSSFRKTHKFLKTREMHLIVQKNTQVPEDAWNAPHRSEKHTSSWRRVKCTSSFRKTHKFLKTREMHLIVQKNTHTSFSIDFSQGSAMFNFWQEWKWGCEGLKYSAFNGLHCCLITIPNQTFQ